MRQRHIKNLEEKMAPLKYLEEEAPDEKKGKWAEAFDGSKDVYAEIGCGKGKFICGMAELHPERAYVAFEGHKSVVYHAMKRADALSKEKGKAPGIRFVTSYVHDISEIFGTGELAGIYLNFSDPWPKDRHEKRRLTCAKMLESYVEAVRPGGTIEIRTDNDELFDYTMDEVMNLAGASIVAVSRDLHNELREVASRIDATILEEEAFREGLDDEQDSLQDLMVTSEYEDKFAGEGKTINYLMLRRCHL